MYMILLKVFQKFVCICLAQPRSNHGYLFFYLIFVESPLKMNISLILVILKTLCRKDDFNIYSQDTILKPQPSVPSNSLPIAYMHQAKERRLRVGNQSPWHCRQWSE